MESANVGRFKDVNLFLISEGKQFFLAFGSPMNHHYWLVALNRILEERPDYKFQVRLSEEDQVEIDMQEFKSTLEMINGLTTVINIP